MEILETIWNLIRAHAGTVGLILTWLGIGLVYFRRRADWQRKSFMSQVNFSLNYVQDRKLCLRTLLETTATEVWLNDYGIKQVFNAAKQTRADQPFIILDDAEDMAFVKRAVLNVLSEKFAESFLAQPVGVPARTARFCFAVTFENFADMRTRKIRVLLMEVDSLKGQNWDSDIMLDNAWHRDRVTVLKMMRDIYLGQSPLPKSLLGEVELGLVA